MWRLSPKFYRTIEFRQLQCNGYCLRLFFNLTYIIATIKIMKPKNTSDLISESIESNKKHPTVTNNDIRAIFCSNILYLKSLILDSFVILS